MTLRVTAHPETVSALAEPTFSIASRLITVSPSGFRGNVIPAIKDERDLPISGEVSDFLVLAPETSDIDASANLLRRASEITKFGILKSPIDDDGPEVVGDTEPEVLGAADHTHQLSVIRKMIQRGGFDVLAETIVGQPTKFDTARADNGVGPRLNYSESQPDFTGESVYVALMKSRNVRIVNPETARAVHGVLADEFGAENLVSTAIFGSVARSTDKKHSDYDFTVIVRDLPTDVYERDLASPRIKRRLRDAGVNELCAFNLYTPEEFQQANDRRFWLIETMKLGNRVLYDTDGFMREILEAGHAGVERVENSFAWKGADFVSAKRFEDVIDRHLKAADVLKSTDSQMADIHTREAQRVALIAKLYEHGEATSRGSLLLLAKRLNAEYGEEIDFSAIQLAEFQQESEGKRTIFGYDTIERHLKAAKLLEVHGMPIESLWHTSTALRNLYLRALHSNDNFIVEGEVTQLFLREFGQKLPADLTDRIYRDSFKAEQILGRSGFISFDLDAKGESIYEDPESSGLDYLGLCASLREIISELREAHEAVVSPDQSKSRVTVVISASNGSEQLDICIASLNALVVPEGMLDIRIVDISGDEGLELETAKLNTKWPTRITSQTHGSLRPDEFESDYVAFINDDMVVSPLWLVNLLSGFKSDKIAAVSAANASPPLAGQPTTNELAEPAIKDIMGEVVNILAASSCFRRDSLAKIDLNIGETLPVAGQRITRELREAGHSLEHVDGAVTYLME